MTPTAPIDDVDLDQLKGVLRYFSWGDERIEGQPTDMQQLEQALAFRVGDLLERDLNRLTQIFYHVDLPEPAVRETFDSNPPGALPLAIARLLIDRERDRIRQRRAFESQLSEEVPECDESS